MSAAAEGSSSTTKAVTSDTESGTTMKDQQKPAATLEEDDEFEDFPVEGLCLWKTFITMADWSQEDTEVPGGNAHLWEESWDDDDTTEDFSAQLKEELKKVEANKRA
ncbi:MAG: 26S proteasome complex subunit [Sclerophora amabilis]|nr:MAG: 26S proteasome complex subunit [Sclerophora amabilis]